MVKSTGKQLRAKEFAQYLTAKLNGLIDGLEIQTFTVDTAQFKKDVRVAIKLMEANKSVGTDGIHVKILKANTVVAAEMMNKFWSSARRAAYHVTG